MAGPLADVKVLDLCSALAGPLTSQLLGDLGADVLKIERPTGDGFRGRLWEESDEKLQTNPRFDGANRNKRSVVIDVNKPEAKEIYDRLIKWADVIIENFRPGTPEKLGFGYERCKELNPRIIFVSLTGYGETGPWRNRAGSDPWAEALAGNVAVQGNPGGEPMLGGGTPFVDHATPLSLAYGVTTALYQREKTGLGCLVNGSLLETALFLNIGTALSDYLNGGNLLVKSGRAWNAGFPQGAYNAKDGVIVTMMITNKQWDAFTRVLELGDEYRGPKYDTHEKRVDARFELYPVLDAAFSKKDRGEWAKLFAKTGIIRADPALRYDEVPEHPQVQATESIITTPHSRVGVAMAIASPVTVDGHRCDARMGPPSLGEHTREVLLGEMGYSQEEVDTFFAENTIYDDTNAIPFKVMQVDRDRYSNRLTGAQHSEETGAAA